ncbi:MAG TPA: RraA family protein [Rhizomicrobium sp.]|nr:RraA family protein [Rhizomicrobium sp.]
MRIQLTSWKAKSVSFLVGGLLTCLVGSVVAQPLPDAKTYAANPALLIDAYRHVEVASVSDALEQLYNKRSFMTHRIHAISDGKMAGFAVTVQMDNAEGAAPSAVTPMQAAIDTAPKDSVYVMAVADGDDIAGIGGLMATAMNARGFSGAVIDGGVRDVAYLKKIAFPVYASGIVPSTSVGHYRATQAVPVTAGGVRISPGDIIVADADGVVAVPKDVAAEVLVKAQALDQTEHSMYGYIEKLRSLEEAVQRFGRL